MGNERFITGGGGTPNHPLLKNWQEPTVKRAIQEAVKDNADYFAWISGEQTSARYNLKTYLKKVDWVGNKEIRKIILHPTTEKAITFNVENGKILSGSEFGMGGVNVPSGWTGKSLDEVLGKGLADKIMEKESGTLSGEGLKFGGEWANNLYDKQVADIVHNVTGAKVEKLNMGLPIDYNPANQKDWTILSTKEKLTPKNIKVGTEISGNPNASEGQKWIITGVKGGKVEIVKKAGGLEGTNIKADSWVTYAKEHPDKVETFDISVKKSPYQLGIELTPEIKATIRGKAPKFEASGKQFE